MLSAKIVETFGRSGSAPNPAVGAHSALPDPWWGQNTVTSHLGDKPTERQPTGRATHFGELGDRS